ncbi:MAG: diversity-generating retroelement protein Avd [Patescibacteria group bacterium]
MSQLNFHKNNSFNNTPPQRSSVPIIRRFIEIYKLWHEYLQNFPKTSRYSLGLKIDSLFIEIIGSLFSASYLSGREKLPILSKASNNLDMLKFFLEVAWEIKLLDNKKYIVISEKLNEIGNMLGGWIRKIITQTPSK